MAGASERTRRVDYVNANWVPGSGASRGTFELHVVTDDGERHALPVHGDDVAGVVALTTAGGVLLFDPEASTLIIANVAGEWFQPDWTPGRARVAGPPHGRPGTDGDAR